MSRRAWRAVAVAGLLAVAAAAPLAAQRARLRAGDVDALPSRPADARIAYGADSLQFGDLRLPPGPGPFPVAIVLHGGCWIARYANHRNTAALADALREAGVATWNLEYRTAEHPGGGWPGTLLDVADGADFVRELARRYPLDTTRVMAIGHSAGGHLALWLAARPRLPAGSPVTRAAPLRLRAAISLAGPGDLAEFVARETAGCRGSALLDGTPASRPDRYALADPSRLLPFGVPHLLITGDGDFIMPPGPSEAWRQRAAAAGDSVRVIEVPNAGHFEVIAPGSVAWPTVRDAVRDAVRAAVGR